MTQLTATGGTPPYTWSTVTTLPAGIALSSGGLLSGTPSAAVSGSFTVRLTDSVGATTTADVWIDAISLAPAVPPVVEQMDFTVSFIVEVEMSGSDLVIVPFDFSLIPSVEIQESSSIESGTGIQPRLTAFVDISEDSIYMPLNLLISVDISQEAVDRYSATIATLLGTSGLTLLRNSAEDDNNVNVGDIGFNFPLYGVNFRADIFAVSNSYLTFGFATSAYSGLSPTNPSGTKLFVGSADRSWNQLWAGPFTPVGGGLAYRIRWHGNTGTSGSGTEIWEATLFDDGAIMLVFGTTGLTSGQMCLTNGLTSGTLTTTYTIASNTSFVFTPDGSGGYIVRTGSYI
jgi:hypothetical protein